MTSPKTAVLLASALSMLYAAEVATAAPGVDRPGSDSYQFWRLVGEPAYAHHPADGGYRCRGISYGTGAQSCGTVSGGPVGGLNGRN